MSLRDLARRRLAIIRGVARETSRETDCETARETSVKQPKRLVSAVGPCFTPDETNFPQKTTENEPCFTVSPTRARNSETRLPADVETGLRALRSMSCPARVNWDSWRGV